MRRLVVSLLVLVLFLAGCQSGTYKIPREEFTQQVRTLGVLPILIDEDSSIQHPQGEEVLALLRRHSAAREERLIQILRDGGGFFDVRHVNQDPRRLSQRLLVAREADDGGLPYDFSASTARQIADELVVDALLVVTLHGREVVERRWDRTRLNFLEAPYNNVLAAAVVIDRDGQILWRLDEGAGAKFLALQYPDFDEAFYNKADAVRLKFLTPQGVERTLEEPGGGLLARSTYPKLYAEVFERIGRSLKPGVIRSWRPAARPQE
ncbi:hypothetical protein SAMN05660860_02759 [Geoalkalibacter ferrihydriticus]|uniref:Lipoprotein n=2 Tax=Geoalkalibacter ferrihydriticus TaxID=392333 RepID=A0A0C2EBG8_9BACT|nr:hypothetical protein [Geoalkalibacter ferrihydriticus]KIH75938.1 hypothetical protein GFER_13585 [Geoalkalibacter ferrihydriticus DSM 17813]SDM56220.1 hypothetical protein SAMN05660860_02759 [Geoalkalibacter ferrihydriticus]